MRRLSRVDVTGTLEPWRVAVTGIVTERAAKHAPAALAKLFSLAPDPVSMAALEWREVVSVLQCVWRRHLKARNLLAFSRRWLMDDWSDMRELPGVGLYVADCVGLFCFGDLDLESHNADLITCASQLRDAASVKG